ncbi:hypothetical protein Halru_0426 [Halovivax ruber XH-70]|uniref:Uncharacterized protein n=1 Tax=Halovivax ruber (strain DSM 18193 / JCM 13892 / XH-70) TaxID=797302 RepID=L0I8D4_HALRX|nr:hypothetical protein [Halovivax ruber]AGB15068.1 hypothetical protein Halru_0426 [Halovivax ruber XH-70]
MDGLITGENSERIGLSVIDNNHVEHIIEMEFDGEIKHHDQDGYPDDPADRTEEGNERVNQARRYARYVVFVEGGYDTMPAAENPVRIDGVRQVIDGMDSTEFEQHFSDLYQQLAYEEGDGTEPVLTAPEGATDPCIYCTNLYLGIDPLETDFGQQLAVEHDLDVTDSAADIDLTDVSPGELDTWAEYAGEFAAYAETSMVNLNDAAYLDAVSALYVKYPDGPSLTAVDDHLEPAAREPDTVIELLPIDPQNIEYFQSFMDHYLRCQIRDSYVEMGVHPPEKFRVIGMGRFMSSWRYDNIDFYPEFHDPNATVFN